MRSTAWRAPGWRRSRRCSPAARASPRGTRRRRRGPRLPPGTDIANLDEIDLAQFDSLVVSPGLPLNRHPIAQPRPRGRRRDHRRHRAVRPRPARASAAQGGRDHRHQRQVDHHRAGPPHPQDRGRADDDGRQHRPADPRPGPAAGRRRLCARAVELPDRPDAEPRLRRRGAAQHHARSSRPLRQLRGLCGFEGSAVRDAVRRHSDVGSYMSTASKSARRCRKTLRTSRRDVDGLANRTVLAESWSRQLARPARSTQLQNAAAAIAACSRSGRRR